MTEPSESVLRRVRALLERAEHEKTPEPERDSAMAMAAKLMAEYGIVRTMLAAAGEADNAIDQTEIALTDPYSFEKGSLLYRVATALGCKTLRYTRGRKSTRMAVVGTASDRERVNMLYTSLLLQAERGMHREASGYDAAGTRARRAGFLAGFAERIYYRLTEAESRAAQDYDTQHGGGGASGGTALVLADRTALVKRRYAELFPNINKNGGSRMYDSAAYGRGDTAGRSADIGTTRVGGRGALRLGS
jgi:hypothetical protein